MFPTRLLRTTAVLALLQVVAGCAHFGPEAIRDTRGNYNIAVQQTANEQLLLNIVRLKYRDTPSFLELTSVTTSFSLAAGSSLAATFQGDADPPYTVGATIDYTDKPTVTYTPLQGDKFVAQIMSPVDPEVLALLYHSGWSVARILSLTTQSLNGLDNAHTASGPTPTRKPRFEEFKRAVALLRQLQQDGSLQLGAGDDGFALALDPQRQDTAAVAELRQLLDLDPDLNRYPVVAGIHRRGDALALNPRSLMGILFYVAQAVEPPARDIASGRVTRTLDAAGNPFDWSELTGDLIRVRSAAERPADAYVAIHYRGAWFYIDDRDLNSKSTFALLTQLSALAAGDVRSTAPVLTLPIGQ